MLRQPGVVDMAGDATPLRRCNDAPGAYIPILPSRSLSRQSSFCYRCTLPINIPFPRCLRSPRAVSRGEGGSSTGSSAAVPPPWCRAQTGPQRGSRRATRYFGSVGGPVPAAHPRGTPPLGSRQRGVCPGNAGIVGAPPRDMPICRKRSRNGSGRLWKMVFKAVQARPANCQGSSCVGWAGVVLPEKPSPYGWGEGVGAGRRQSRSERISADPRWAWGYFRQLSLCPRLR